MSSITRRNLVISAATAGAALGLGGPIEFIGTAAAQKALGTDLKKSKSFKLGDLQVTTVYDGIWEKAHDANFIKGVSIDETKKALAAAKQTDAFVPITFTVTIVKRGNDYIMFDSGTGGQASPKAGELAANLKAAGIDRDRIKTIIVTHYHGDHIFGLMEKGTNAQVFLNAEIIVPAAEHKYWSDPAVLAKLPEARQGLAKRVQATLATWKNVRPFEGGKEVVKGIRPIPAHGHTPGHTAYLVTSGRNQLIVSADATNIPALFVRHPTWQAAFDQDADMAVASRKKLFDRAVADGVIVTGYHWGLPGAGRLKKDGSGYVYMPIA